MNPRRQRRTPVPPYLTPRSVRSLEEACKLAGLPEPTTAAELGEVYLRLLIAGLDHRDFGGPTWFIAIHLDAPKDSVPPAVQDDED